MSIDRSASAGMSFSAGQRLGPYTISSFLGAGGMAEVYAARDERFGREVAIKAISAHRADSERLRRFKQEAKTTGQLSHPNIVAVYDVGDEGEIPYLVTELLDGQTLRSRIDEGPCSIDETLRLAIQLCRGLAAAHAKGVVHRDLKPSNLFLLRDGHLKILDFGLAKVVHPEWERLQSDDDTISVLSSPGTVFGSVGYMAPEQVEGDVVDHRSDIFAVGTILYEMMTGIRAFRESSPVATLHAILKETPKDLQSLRPEIPDALAAIVRRCMAKKAAERFQTVEDLVFALQSLRHATSGAGGSFLRLSVRPRLLWATLGLALCATLLFSFLSQSAESTIPDVDPGAVRPAVTTELTPSANYWDGAVTPDLRFLAYSYGSGQSNGIRLKHLPSGNEIDLVPSSSAITRWPTAFSADGNHLYYEERLDWEHPYEMRRISLLGGDSQILVQTEQPMLGIDFAPNQTKFAFISQDHLRESRLAVITGNTDGSSLQELASITPQEGIADLRWFPDGRFLVVSHPPNDLSELVRLDAFTGVQQPLFEQPVESLSIMGIDWLSDGSGFVTTVESTGQIVHVSYPEGEVTRVTDEAGQSRVIHLIDDQTALIRARSVQSNLWLVDPWNGQVIERITSGLDSDDGVRGLSWGPGDIVYFSALGADGGLAIWACDSDGAHRRQITRPQPGLDHVEVQASPDGTYIVYRETDRDLIYWNHTGTSRIVKASIEGKDALTLSADHFAESPQITSDSEWVVYSRATGAEERSVWKVARDGSQRTRIDAGVPCWLGGIWSDDLISCYTYLGRSEFVLSIGDGATVWTGDIPTGLPAYRLPPLPFSPDGRGLLYLSFGHGSGELWFQSFGEAEPRLLLKVPDLILNFASSPEDQRMVVSRNSQVRRLFLAQNLPIPGPR